MRLPIETVVQSKVQQIYGQSTTPLPLVVISHGAQVIRKRWSRTFGNAVVFLFDWYHLSEKLRQLMSMIARNKTEKSEHCKVLLTDLWHGDTQQALHYLQHQVAPRNQEKWQELLTYLEKHQVEKAVDQVIGVRRKRKGKSWRPQGSRALGLLKVLQLNGKWHQFWFSEQTVA